MTVRTSDIGPLRRLVGERSSWALPVALAVAIVALPAMSVTDSGVFPALSYTALESLALTGVVLGWLLADRMPTIAHSKPFVIGAIAVLSVIGYGLAITGAGAVDIIGLGVLAGSLVRGGRRGPADRALPVALAAMSTWITYDVPNVLYKPMRDLHSYLAAAGDALAGHSAYLQAPLTAPPDWDRNPFVYPPFTLPLFELLARLPLFAVEVGWLAMSAGAVLIGLRLIGVRGRWLIGLLAWPVFAVGLSVGNVAAFGFLCFALGYRFALFLVVAGVFKVYSGIPAIWGIRQGRYRELALGVAVVAVLVIVTIPLTGLAAWAEWARALGYFEQAVDRYDMRGPSLMGSLPPALGLIVSVAAIGFALLRRGRNGLARFGLASIVVSPTLYLHGFAPMLPGALTLRPEIFWFALALVPWDAWLLPISGGWVAVAIVAAALRRSTGEALSGQGDFSDAAADLHPGAGGQVWPAAGSW
jgi:glycosyl transferase family 87